MSVQSTIDSFEESLLYVLRLLGSPLSATALRSRVAKLPGPWSAEDVAEAAESLGFTVEAVTGRVDRSWTHFPLIFPLSENDAVVVVAQPEADQFELYWPGEDGTSQVSAIELEALCSHQQQEKKGLLITRRARATTMKDGPVGRYGHWFFGPIFQAKKLYLQVAIAALLTNLFAVTTSIFSMTVYDRVIPNGAVDTLYALLIGAGIIFFSDFLIRSLRGYFLDVAGARADMVVGDTLFEQILDMQMGAKKGSTGSVANMLKEFESLREFLTSTTLVTLIDIPFTIIFLLLIWTIGGPMVWVPLAVIPLMLGAGLLVQPRLSRLTEAAYEDGQNKQSVLVETLNGMETIKSLGAGALMRHRWQQAVLHQSELGLKQRMWSSFATNVANLSQQLVQVGVVTTGFFLVGEGQIGFGAIIASSILAGRAISPLSQLSQLLSRMNQSLSSYRALSELMTQPREHSEDRNFITREQFSGKIEFRDVSFTYPGSETRTLNNLSFTIEPGERVAILGKIGSGKTTVAKLMLGLYQPDEGAVLIDGVDVRQIDPADLRKGVGAVLQDVWLMSGSIRENIALGVDAISDEAVLKAARIAGVEDFISQHPHGYSLQVGERGEGLSGGQRQAVSIARAIVAEPTIWLFDEPSSAMDQQAEVVLVNRLQEAIGERTFVTITHKSSMVALASKVVVIDQGRATYVGPPEKVLGART
ncbi:MAG: type I secretion system permease/ATPase [Gammaproteobacteria bacterium]|jgi:ATP-binding cassette subfamily C protein LapB|nr:type I secretion system permease/ATPase [Candidatus Neomarinimicrobiota bacterium]MBT4330377.1 type I secretion system permease/ATPase [Gammaproteobacteria bacterium]MBT5634875.1 type I secretion system permease/ATPase [Gammaproteobacteria bacterium]